MYVQYDACLYIQLSVQVYMSLSSAGTSVTFVGMLCIMHTEAKERKHFKLCANILLQTTPGHAQRAQAL